MRRFRKLIVPVLIALLLVASNVFQNILASVGWDLAKDNPFVKKWGVLIQVGIVINVAILYALWDHRREHPIPEAPGDHPQHMRQRLLARVLEFAQAQFDGGLYAKARKEFQLAERPLQVRTQDRLMDVTIEQYYRDLKSPLVILGAPGTGKTTLLYELATVLCTGNDADAIPVPFILSNWALKEEPLAEWMLSELRRNYGVGAALAKSWVSKEVVLPLLDGLDEVPAEKRPACATRINEYRLEHPGLKFAVTCREAEYEELNATLALPSGVVVRTLSRTEVAAYLDSNEPKLNGLRQLLDAEPALWDLMDTPLMLWVGAFAFEQGPGLASSSSGPIRDRLLDRYVDAMLKRERGQDQHEHQDPIPIPVAKVWLHRTAECMTRAGVLSFHLEDLSPRWLPEDKVSACVWMMRVFSTSILALYVLAVTGRLVVAVITGALCMSRIEEAEPADAISWSSTELFSISTLLVGLAIGVAAGLGTALLGGGPGRALITVMGTMLLGGVSIGFTASSVHQRSKVNSGLKRSATYFATGVPFLLLGAVGLRSWDTYWGNILAGTSLAVGILQALFHGGMFCLKNLIMRCQLVHAKCIPWRYEAFLYFSVERVLMIRQGGSFRFIHRMLQEHLAIHPPSTSK